MNRNRLVKNPTNAHPCAALLLARCWLGDRLLCQCSPAPSTDWAYAPGERNVYFSKLIFLNEMSKRFAV